MLMSVRMILSISSNPSLSSLPCHTHLPFSEWTCSMINSVPSSSLMRMNQRTLMCPKSLRASFPSNKSTSNKSSILYTLLTFLAQINLQRSWTRSVLRLKSATLTLTSPSRSVSRSRIFNSLSLS